MNLIVVSLTIYSVFTIKHVKSNDESEIIENIRFCGNLREPTEETCHSAGISEDISELDERHVSENSIFFIQPSCTGGLNIHQACSVESAARAHPDRQINVLFVGPVQRACLSMSHMSAVISYINVNFYRVNITNYIGKSPLNLETTLKALNASEQPMAYINDVLKYLTLYQFGGVYMDLDMIVIYSLDSLPQRENWVPMDNHKGLGSSMLSFSKHGVGRNVAFSILKRIKELIDIPQAPSKYQYDDILLYVMKMICGTPIVSEMENEPCDGFKVYGSKYFYPEYDEKVHQFIAKYGFDTDRPAPYTFRLWQDTPSDPAARDITVNNFITVTYCPMISDLL